MAFIPLFGTNRKPRVGSMVVGPAHPPAEIQVTVHVRPSADPQNTRFRMQLRGVVGQGIKSRNHLTRHAYAQAYGISQTDIDKVRRFARQYNLRIVRDALAAKTNAEKGAHRSVELQGTIRNFNRAFQIELVREKDAQGRIARTYYGSLSIPEEYQDVVENVLGLDIRPQVAPRFQPAYAPSAVLPAYTPVEVAKLYNFPTGGLTGKGQTVAILEFGGGVRRADLRTYFKRMGLPTPKVKFVSVGRGHNRPTGDPNGPDGEVMLDVEVAGAVAPGATFVMYFAGSDNRSFFRAINAAAHDNVHKPSIISISWGGPEGTWTTSDMTSIDQALQAAAAVGISVFVAAGDQGSTDTGQGSVPNVDFPGSSPYATSCGGTRMVASGGAIVETVWNDNPNSGTGGGISDVFPLSGQPLPDYQLGLGTRLTSVTGRVGRGVPDVAGNADPNTGYKVRVDGVDTVVGGTSAVAPLWAGLFALINESLASQGLPSAGFANTLLYSTKMVSSGAFRDITVGNNDTTGKVGGYVALSGWDPCTGLGTPASGTTMLNVIKST